MYKTKRKDEAAIKAVLVELNYKGTYSRFALTPEEFKEEYRERLAEDMPAPNPYPDEAETYTLRPMVHVWYVFTIVGSSQWTVFFTDMSVGLPDSDVESGNLAYIDMGAMKSLRPYLPVESSQFWDEEFVCAAVKSGVDEANIQFWQHYIYKDEKWPLVFVRMNLTQNQVIRLLASFDEWYGDTPQETTEWALEYQILARMLLNGVDTEFFDSYVLVNPMFLDMDDEFTLTALESILGKVNMGIWTHFHNRDWSGVTVSDDAWPVELKEKGGITV